MNGRVIRDCALAVLGLAGLTALSLWLAWVTDWVPNLKTFRQAIAVLILAGFGCLLSLFVVLVGVLRADHYAGRERSRLLYPSIASAGWLTVYFGIASISAVDVLYQYEQPWPLMRDPGVQLIAVAIVFGIVGAKAWMLFEITRGRMGSSQQKESP